MKINALGSLNTNFRGDNVKYNSQGDVLSETPCLDDGKITSVLDSLSVQNRQGIVTNSKKPFDVNSLSDMTIEDVFSDEEISLAGKRIPMSALLNLAYSYMSEQVRYMEQTGNLMPYREREIIEECRYKGLDEEQTQQRIEEAKKAFINSIEEDKIEAHNAIDMTNPTTEKHTVYRVLNEPYIERDAESYNKITQLKSGEKVKLSATPIYVSTSAKRTISNYRGGAAHDAVLFEIELPKGSKLFTFPSSDGIQQCLMRPDAEFRVLENKKYKDNFHLIKLEYILP